MKPGISFIISLSRGILISGALIMLLPIFYGSDALWAAMPVTEFVVALFIIRRIMNTAKELTGNLLN